MSLINEVPTRGNRLQVFMTFIVKLLRFLQGFVLMLEGFSSHLIDPPVNFRKLFNTYLTDHNF